MHGLRPSREETDDLVVKNVYGLGRVLLGKAIAKSNDYKVIKNELVTMQYKKYVCWRGQDIGVFTNTDVSDEEFKLFIKSMYVTKRNKVIAPGYEYLGGKKLVKIGSIEQLTQSNSRSDYERIPIDRLSIHQITKAYGWIQNPFHTQQRAKRKAVGNTMYNRVDEIITLNLFARIHEEKEYTYEFDTTSRGEVFLTNGFKGLLQFYKARNGSTESEGIDNTLLLKQCITYGSPNFSVLSKPCYGEYGYANSSFL